MLQNVDQVRELRWKKFPVLDDGFICLVDVMGDDSSVIQAARLSYGRDTREVDPDYNTDTTDFPKRPCNTCGSTSNPQYKGVCNKDCIPELEGPTFYERQRTKKDNGLLRYLMRHRHTTPFEMAEVKLLIRIPMDAWRQWIRHRTANVNEYSTRYTEAIDSAQQTSPDRWRLQSKTNKQGSSDNLLKKVGDLPELQDVPVEYTGFVIDTPKDPVVAKYARVVRFVEKGVLGKHDIACRPEDTLGDILSTAEEEHIQQSRLIYQERLAAGVAREQARKDLPLSTYTEAYWKCDLHNILHFLGLRMDSHAQKEIRDYATILGEEIIAKLFPVTWEAFQDYRMQAMNLSRLDILVIQMLHNGTGLAGDILASVFVNDRERDECREKLRRLGFSNFST